MDLYDQHLHSRYSFDSRAEPEDNVQAALAAGLAGLTFTEHFDTHPDDRASCIYDDEAYTAKLQALRQRFGGEIYIGKGIEVCFQPASMPFILEFLDRHTFDLVLLSVHYFGERAVHTRKNWTGIDAATGTRMYLEHVLDAARYCADLHEKRGGRVFDVFGHFDLVKRYTQRFFGSYDVSASAAVIDEALRALVAADVTPEINTSSLRQGLAETMPGPTTLRRFAQLGGRVVSLGSDAHRAEDIGASFEQACAMIPQAGLSGTAVFKGRSRSVMGLE